MHLENVKHWFKGFSKKNENKIENTIWIKNMNLNDKKFHKFFSFIMKFDIFFQLILEDNIGMKDFCLDIKKIEINIEVLYINDKEICKFQNLKGNTLEITALIKNHSISYMNKKYYASIVLDIMKSLLETKHKEDESPTE